METITEGKAKINVPTGKVSRKLEVFYNPVMETNRTVSVKVLNAVDNKHMQMCDLLAGSGVRSARFLLELNKGKIKRIDINDIGKKAVRLIKQNLRLNKLKSKFKIFNKDANGLMMESKGYDYIDIDPFGTPNPFLELGVKKISRGGILAVTATDTGCLCGSFPEACRRKYWAEPKKDYMMHERGLRILIRKVQLVSGQYDKALVPILSYYKDHYFRIFFRCEKGKKKVDKIIEQHDYVDEAGPLWIGKLFDKKLMQRIEDTEFIRVLKKESKVDLYGFYDLPTIASKYKIQVPKMDKLINVIKKKGKKAVRTHFREQSIKSDISEKGLVGLIKKIK